MAHLVVVYDATVDGKAREFGIYGNLPPSTGALMLLYDQGTNSCWWEGSGKCMKGTLKGKQLKEVRTGVERTVRWADWVAKHRDSQVVTSVGPA